MIQGIPDELTPMAEAQTASIKSMACPRCHSSMAPHLDARFVYGEDALPRTMAKCPECGSIIDPRNGIVYDRGDARKVEDPLPIVKPSAD